MDIPEVIYFSFLMNYSEDLPSSALIFSYDWFSFDGDSLS